LRRVPLAFIALALASLAAHAIGAPREAEAAPSAAQQLVAKYAPILLVRKQENPPCDTSEEQYEPTTVNVVLGNPQVVLERVVKKIGRASCRERV